VPGERFSTKRPDTFAQTITSSNFKTSCSQAADHTLSPITTGPGPLVSLRPSLQTEVALGPYPTTVLDFLGLSA